MVGCDLVRQIVSFLQITRIGRKCYVGEAHYLADQEFNLSITTIGFLAAVDHVVRVHAHDLLCVVTVDPEKPIG